MCLIQYVTKALVHINDEAYSNDRRTIAVFAVRLCNNTQSFLLSLPEGYSPLSLPYVDDLSVTPSMLVVVEDDVAVSPIESSISGGLHRHLVSSLNTPDLRRLTGKHSSY